MNINRQSVLWTLAALFLVWGAWQLYAGWGLVTIHADDAPLSKVLSEIRRQGGIEVVTNLDPGTPVTLHVERVPPVQALDVVAVRTDASWRLAYLGAPVAAAIDEAIASFAAGEEIADWSSHGTGGFSLIEPASGEVLDLRRVEWIPSGGGSLPDVLQEAAETTGVLLAAPSAWTPDVAAPPGGAMASAVPRLFRDAKGVSREIFLLRGGGGPTDEEGPRNRAGGWIGTSSGASGGPGRMRGRNDPERVAAQAEAKIALLPSAEQPKARENFRMMQEFWQSVRDLPEEERRAKAREFFRRPEVVEAMETRRLSRWAKLTPEQRIDRSKRYWDRKSEARRESR
jgi:hypothetical protein